MRCQHGLLFSIVVAGAMISATARGIAIFTPFGQKHDYSDHCVCAKIDG